MGLSIYTAASFSRRDEIRQYAYKLRWLGYDITSSWVDRYEPDLALTPEGREQIAMEDIFDIDRAQAIVKFNDAAYHSTNKTVPRHLLSAARAFEFGWAAARGKRLFAIGDGEVFEQGIFDSLPNVCHLPSFAALVIHLNTFYPIQKAA
jgi:hypothetical protein